MRRLLAILSSVGMMVVSSGCTTVGICDCTHAGRHCSYHCCWHHTMPAAYQQMMKGVTTENEPPMAAPAPEGEPKKIPAGEVEPAPMPGGDPLPPANPLPEAPPALLP